MTYLYKLDFTDVKNMSFHSCDEVDLKVFIPSLWGAF